MSSLASTIRRLTGATDDTVVTDADITDALTNARMRHDRVPVTWDDTIDETGERTYLTGTVWGWGKYEPATDADDQVIATVTLTTGAAVDGGWSLEQDGRITFDTDQAANGSGVVVSAYTYDVHAAAAEVVEQLAMRCAGDYTVKLGDQTFSRGEGAERLRVLAQSFRGRVLPRRARMQRMDVVASPVRRGRAGQQRRRGDWS